MVKRPRGFELTKVSLTTSESETKVSRSAKPMSAVNEAERSNPAGRANKKASIKEVFLLVKRPRGFELTKVSLTTSESETKVSRSAKPMSAVNEAERSNPAGRANKKASIKEVFLLVKRPRGFFLFI